MLFKEVDMFWVIPNKYIELLSIHLKALGKGEKLKEKEKKEG